MMRKFRFRCFNSTRRDVEFRERSECDLPKITPKMMQGKAFAPESGEGGVEFAAWQIQLT